MISQADIPDLWSGPYRAYADRLLAHCLIVRRDPPATEFVQAVRLLAQLDRVVRTMTVVPIEHRIERDAMLHTCALTLAELAQEAPSTPRDGAGA